MSVDEKIALVTGATRGIGKAIAIGLGKKGMTVLGTATSQQGVDTINQTLKDNNIKGEGIVLDITDLDGVTNLFSTLKEKDLLPSVVVNNAGVTQDNIFLRMTSDQWDAVINTNLNSIYRMSKTFLKPMVKSRWGRIINITSVVGVSGNPGQANYCAAKAGVIGFTKSLAQEIAVRGITVNCVAPGFIDTDMTRKLTDDQKSAINGQIPMKRVGTTEEVASVVTFLASEEAAYITGQTLHVNGGMYMV